MVENIIDMRAEETYMGRLSFKIEDVGFVGPGETVVDKTITFGHDDYRCTCVYAGCSNCVILVNEATAALAYEIGTRIENARCFRDDMNTQITQVIDRNSIKLEIYEGGMGYTLYSLTGCCAAAGALYKIGLVGSQVKVHMPGGSVMVRITMDYDVYVVEDI